MYNFHNEVLYVKYDYSLLIRTIVIIIQICFHIEHKFFFNSCRHIQDGFRFSAKQKIVTKVSFVCDNGETRGGVKYIFKESGILER